MFSYKEFIFDLYIQNSITKKKNINTCFSCRFMPEDLCTYGN